jgi:hypothetical protein
LSLSVGCCGLCGGRSMFVEGDDESFLSLSVGCCGLCGGKSVSMGGIVSRFRHFFVIISWVM